MAEDQTNIPVSAPIDTESAGRGGDIAVQSVLRIICTQQNSQGTGFFHKSGNVITADHVVRGCSNPELILPNGTKILASVLATDQELDLAVVKPDSVISATPLKISGASNFSIGMQVSTWGFPGGYGGVIPMLSVGYLSGVDARMSTSGKLIRKWVVNAAFNGGNSGGPLLQIETGEVIGVVSSKLAPISAQTLSILKILETQKFGMQYSGTDNNGQTISFSEAQLVAAVLDELRRQVQLVIGEAVIAEDIRTFLKLHNIDP
jgi:S1-C subfamily serine protease